MNELPLEVTNKGGFIQALWPFYTVSPYLSHVLVKPNPPKKKKKQPENKTNKQRNTIKNPLEFIELQRSRTKLSMVARNASL